MQSARAKNFHVPLPTPIYEALRAEALRQKRPATQLARDAIVRSLTEQRRLKTEKALRDYVAAVAGTGHDVDFELERASAEHLLQTVPWK